MTSCGIVLVGGRSSRMGESKADLDWHGISLAQHAVDVLAASCDEVLVVAAPGQELTLAGARIVRDQVIGRGPLQALSAGLGHALATGVDAAFVCATDMPLLHPVFVTRVLAAFSPGWDVVVPVVDGREQTLAAAYATSLAPVIDELLTSGELRLRALLAHCRVRRLSRIELLSDLSLAAADPELECLVNVNTPEDLARARGWAGQRPS